MTGGALQQGGSMNEYGYRDGSRGLVGGRSTEKAGHEQQDITNYDYDGSKYNGI